MSVEFKDYSIQVKTAIGKKTELFLEAAASEVESAARRNSGRHVRTGQLKGSWSHVVNGNEAIIGSPLENAIWEEFGTGEYAAGGDGRKGGWVYRDAVGKWHFTRGKKPRKNLQKAFSKTRRPIIRRAKQLFGELSK